VLEVGGSNPLTQILLLSMSCDKITKALKVSKNQNVPGMWQVMQKPKRTE
jgi:hypothetical protein